MFLDQSIYPLPAAFTFVNFGCSAKTIIIANDDISGANKIQFSWYGQDIDGAVLPAQALTLDVPTGNGFYMRYVNGAPNYRLIVRGN